MMKNTYILFFCLLSLSFQLTAQKSQLVIYVVDFENNKGQVILDIYNNEKGFPIDAEKAIKRVVGTINNKTASFDVTDLPLGEYAFVVIHDENKNNELDDNFIGIPTEALGVSKNVKGRFGPPSFDDAMFTLTNTKLTMKVIMRYL
jgi:uncharacterized protein (DUF2141 family)